MYEFFEHTADVGLRARAPSLEALFAEAGRGLLALLVDEPDRVRPARRVTVEVSDGRGDPAQLLHAWLSELLYRFEVHRQLLCRFNVRLTDTGLRAEARGEPIDPARHRLAHEIKAVTYHELKVQPSATGWLAEVVLDI